jgi:hypothetical protein
MRALIVAFGLFMYVSMDITVNHGANVHGMIAAMSSVLRSLGF